MASMKSNVRETWVSTDDIKISNIAKSYGCNVIDRPHNLALDDSQSEDSLKHFLENINFDYLVFIQPTSPMIKAKDINEGLKMMDVYDSVFSAYSEHWYPRWTSEIKPINWKITKRPMRQDKSNCYVENGAFYLTKKKNLEESGLRYSGKIGVYEMPYYRSFQVDTKDDLILIEKLMNSK